jgi:hypothetical protein
LTDNKVFVEYTVSAFRAEGFFDADGNVLIHEKNFNNQMVKNSITVDQNVVMGRISVFFMRWKIVSLPLRRLTKQTVR